MRGKDRVFIEARNLRKMFVKGGLLGHRRKIVAVDGVSFAIREGETLGLVGESGSGKTTIGRILTGLEKPDEGEVLVRDTPLEKYLESHRIKIQMIFQNPDTSLDPRQKVYDVIAEALEAAGDAPSRIRVQGILRDVGLPETIAYRYPHELSGGQKQRVAIARVIAVKPEFIVADEIVSALDATIKVRILRLIRRLQQEHGFAMLFISHDLPATASVSDSIAVMYSGRIMEYGDARDIVYEPMHPYTAHLVASVPRLYFGDSWSPPHIEMGDEMDDGAMHRGCPLYKRCPRAVPGLCDSKRPELLEIGGRRVACYKPLHKGTGEIRGEKAVAEAASK